MNVYVLEVGCYEDRYVQGVYATPEAAMAAHAPEFRGQSHRVYGQTERKPWAYEWEQIEDHLWRFMADWDDAADIQAYALEGEA